MLKSEGRTTAKQSLFWGTAFLMRTTKQYTMHEKEIYRQAVATPAGPVLTAEKPFMTVDEAAAYLGLSKRYLYNLTSARRIPHKKVGPRAVRFDREALADWLRARTTDVPTRTEQEQAAAAYCARNPR